MEGKYEVSNTNEPLKKHTHVVFHLSDGSWFAFLDCSLNLEDDFSPKKCEEFNVTVWKTIGTEPISWKHFNLTVFNKTLKQKVEQ